MTSLKVRKAKLHLGATIFLATLAAMTGAPSSAVGADDLEPIYAPSAFKPLVRALRQMTITPGHAEIIRYEQEPGTVVVGDSTIAIASIVASDILVLTGLRAGETNVIVLDDRGAGIDQIVLRVAMPGDTVVVRRGIERQIHRCDPRCAPTDEAGLAPAAPTLAPAPSALAIPPAVTLAPGV